MPSDKPVSLARYIAVVVVLLATIPLVRLAERSETAPTKGGSVGLASLPKQVGEWKAEPDRPLDKISLSELEPDDYLSRTYVDPTRYWLDFFVVYGHQKKTFHSPGQCLPGGGFQIVDKSETPAGDDGLPVTMNIFRMQQVDEKTGQKARYVVLYSFVQGNRGTASIIQHNINLLMAHIRRERATGALVRVIVPVGSTEEAAIARAKDFIRRIYPDLQQRIG